MHVMMVDAAAFSPPYDYALSSALERAGARVTMVEPAETRADWGRDRTTASVQRSARGLWGKVRKGVAHAHAMRELVQRVRTLRPDVVHFQWLPLPLVDLAAIRACRRQCPLVFTMHNTSIFHGSSSRLQGLGTQRAYALFNRIVVHSEFGKRAALAAGRATEAQLVLIPHGAFTHYAELSPPEHVEREGPQTILFAGSIKQYKGLDVLIRALAHLSSSYGPGELRLVVAGQPGMPMESVRELANSLRVDHLIEWRLRHQSEQELADALAHSHIVVLPYREIDQSGVLLAAVGMGRAVVASAIGGIPEIIEHGVNGLLVAPEDDAALARALGSVLTSPDTQTRFERAMRLHASTSLGWDAAAKRTLDVYRALSASRSAAT